MAESYLHGPEVLQIDDDSRPINITDTSTIGLVGTAPDADDTKFPYDVPVFVNSPSEIGGLKAATGPITGTLYPAARQIFDQTGAGIIFVRVREGTGATPAEKLASTVPNIIGGTTGNDYTGMQALIGAKSRTGRKPNFIIAPGFTSFRPMSTDPTPVALANPVTAALAAVADRVRAIVIVQGTNTNDADALAYRDDFGNRRIYMVDPGVTAVIGGTVTGTTLPFDAAAAVAGLFARVDAEKGYWWSPSNQVLNSVIGTTRTVDFTIGDVNSRANVLNAAQINTIIREDGFRLWGNRSLSDDPAWSFITTTRIADVINEALLQSHRWAIDRCMNRAYVEAVTTSVNNFLRGEKAKGAILGGRCWADPALNTPNSLAAGHVYFDFDFTDPKPAERVTFRSHLVDDYIAEIITPASQRLALPVTASIV